METNKLTFLPYFKRDIENLALDQAGENLSGTLEVQISAGANTEEFEDKNTIVKNIITRGPGDIKGILNESIARIEPMPSGTFNNASDTSFEPNYFPFIEFNDPDFLWRYSLDTLNDEDKIKPWLSLVVFSVQELEDMERKNNIKVLQEIEEGRTLLTISKQSAPDFNEAWASAHVQLIGAEEGVNVEDFINTSPDRSCCRLFCMRKLEPTTRYSAFLVPTYKLALKPFDLFEEGITNEVATEGEGDIKLPVYLSWSFITSEPGDFESLARDLKGKSLGRESLIGTRPVFIKEPEEDEEDQSIRFLVREGALTKPGYDRPTFSESELPKIYDPDRDDFIASLIQELEVLGLNLEEEDPLVSYPLYGKFYSSITATELTNEEEEGEQVIDWIKELNLDVRNRIAAAFGTRIVQTKQDEFVRDCWYQVGDIRKANQLLRLSKAGLGLGQSLYKRHIEPLPFDRFLTVTTPFHQHIVVKNKKTGEFTSLYERLKEQSSGLSQGVLSPFFKKVIHGKIGIINAKISTPWEGKESKKIRIAPRPRSLDEMVKKDFDITLEAIPAGEEIEAPKAEIIDVCPIEAEEVLPKFDLEEMIKKKVKSRIDAKGEAESIVPKDLSAIMATPKIRTPLYKTLESISSDYILPGIDLLEKDTIAFLEENRTFIESLMVGANHEMIKELVFREYPIRKEGTVLTQFWDARSFDEEGVPQPSDVEEIVEWSDELGKNNNKEDTEVEQSEFHRPNFLEIILNYFRKIRIYFKHKFWSISTNAEDGVEKAANLVLAIKGDLIRRYPNCTIYIQKISRNEDGELKYWLELTPEEKQRNDDSDFINPSFSAFVGKDISFVGFPLSMEKIKADEESDEARYYIIFQQNFDLPRFGLDLPSRVQGDEPNNDLTWPEVLESSGSYVTNYEAFAENQLITTAALIAKRTYQKPIKAAFYALDLLPKD